MAKSNLTKIIREILRESDEWLTIEDHGVFVYQAQIYSVCFAAEAEELGDHPVNYGWYKWEDVLPGFSEETQKKIREALTAEINLREVVKITRTYMNKIEKQELKAAEKAALEEMKGMSFEEPEPQKKVRKVAKKIKVEEPVTEFLLPRGWIINTATLKAVSPKGGEWDIVKSGKDWWSLKNSKGTSMTIDRNGHVDTMQH